MTKQEFIEKIAQYVLPKYSEYKILPSLCISQAALESGWGKHAPGNNLFGYKWNPRSNQGWQLLWTQEWDGEKYIKIQARFRKYDSIEESIQDYLELMQIKRYAKVKLAQDYKEAAQAVAKAGYATSPVYANSLIKIIEDNKLYKFDKEIETAEGPSPTVTFPNDVFISPHFKWVEFQSPDGAEMTQEVKSNLVELCLFLEILREALGNLPIYITKGGGHRSKSYNQKIRAEAMRMWPYSHWRWPALDSTHIPGQAGDIKIPPLKPWGVARKARDLHFKGGLGVYHIFLHLDTGPKRSWGLFSVY